MGGAERSAGVHGSYNVDKTLGIADELQSLKQ